jgi:hypothetical protein
MTRADPRPQWWHELRTTGAFVRRSRPPQLLGALAGSVAFTAVGVWLISGDGGDIVAGWAAVAFFGFVGIPALGWRLATGNPVLRVDATGVTVGRTAVTWPEIAGVQVQRLRVPGAAPWRPQSPSIVVLALTPAGGQRLAARSSGGARLLQEANDRLLGAGDATLALPTGLGLPTEPLADWLTELRAPRLATRRPLVTRR